ncbi:conserved hypothetical protein [Pediculus humanus corporis]|uniref:Actin-binding transcription modulator n=1 Tax=Pediculus humanus subsp. corporis TaxID=121224 RepID=E0W2B6_PEDHC|nr:uncharacterized protein Phum_PHUM588790 [Pediculus humanus corporis]EEB19772.1 conserved hypothetical protein [Pediculus humanus corporis]
MNNYVSAAIENSFEKFEAYPRVVERYYKPFYFLSNKGLPSEHHCVLMHSNKICLITLAPTHPLIKSQKKITKLDFQVTNEVDRLENKVSGKSKKGGQHLMPDSLLCHVECSDGSKYSIWSCIKGKLLEINNLLLSKPDLMVQKPLSVGFLAIILPSVKDIEIYKKKLITCEKYITDIKAMSENTESL